MKYIKNFYSLVENVDYKISINSWIKTPKKCEDIASIVKESIDMIFAASRDEKLKNIKINLNFFEVSFESGDHRNSTFTSYLCLQIIPENMDDKETNILLFPVLLPLLTGKGYSCKELFHNRYSQKNIIQFKQVVSQTTGKPSWV